MPVGELGPDHVTILVGAEVPKKVSQGQSRAPGELGQGVVVNDHAHPLGVGARPLLKERLHLAPEKKLATVLND